MALAELYSQYLNTSTIYGQERKDGEIQWVVDEGSLTFLLRYLQDIRDEIPDRHGSRDCRIMARVQELARLAVQLSLPYSDNGTRD